MISKPWFRKVGFAYYPDSGFGWLLVAAAGSGMVWVYFNANLTYGSIIDSLRLSALPWGLILAVTYVAARFTSHKH